MIGRRGLAAIAFLGVVSCSGGGGTGAPAVDVKDLGGAIAAKVGDDRIGIAAVERVAKAQGVAPTRARELLVDDAVLAAGARQNGLDPWFEVDAMLARRLSNALLAEAEARGPVTDAELADGSKRYWLDVDRPAARRIAQTVVMVGENPKSGAKEAAKALAEKIRDKALPLGDLARSTEPNPVSFYEPLTAQLDPVAQGLRAATQAIDRGQIKVQWEVDTIGEDSRMLVPNVDPIPTAVPEFTKAIEALETRGDAAFFETQFGFHIVVLLEKTPAAEYSLEERRKKLRDVTIKDRARLAETELLTKLRPQASIERHADGVLGEVVVSQ